MKTIEDFCLLSNQNIIVRCKDSWTMVSILGSMPLLLYIKGRQERIKKLNIKEARWSHQNCTMQH